MYVPSIVNQLIEAKAMAYKAREMGMRISDQELGDAIEAEFDVLVGSVDDQVVARIQATQGALSPTMQEAGRE